MYLAQHMGEQGRWVSSVDKNSCMTDKLEILEYCKKVSDTSSSRGNPFITFTATRNFVLCVVHFSLGTITGSD